MKKKYAILWINVDEPIKNPFRTVTANMIVQDHESAAAVWDRIVNTVREANPDIKHEDICIVNVITL